MTTAFEEKYFIDTNIFIYASFKDMSEYEKSVSILNNPIGDYYISNQVINEYFSVSTNSKIFKKPLNSNEAIENIKHFLKAVKIVNIPNYSSDVLEKDIMNYNLLTKQIFDYCIYHAMVNNGINNIITRNQKDFKVFSKITIVNPFIEQVK